MTRCKTTCCRPTTQRESLSYGRLKSAAYSTNICDQAKVLIQIFVLTPVNKSHIFIVPFSDVVMMTSSCKAIEKGWAGGREDGCLNGSQDFWLIFLIFHISTAFGSPSLGFSSSCNFNTSCGNAATQRLLVLIKPT